MHSDRAFVLCHYRYDPLDRIVGTSPSGQSPLQRFYCKARLATEIQGLLRHTIVQHDDQLLAQQQRNGEHVMPHYWPPICNVQCYMHPAPVDVIPSLTHPMVITPPTADC